MMGDDLDFESFHAPADEYGCVLMGRLPDSSVVQFVVSPTVLVDMLRATNVMGDRAIKHCVEHRQQIEQACRKAYAARPSSRIVLEPHDFG